MSIKPRNVKVKGGILITFTINPHKYEPPGEYSAMHEDSIVYGHVRYSECTVRTPEPSTTPTTPTRPSGDPHLRPPNTPSSPTLLARPSLLARPLPRADRPMSSTPRRGERLGTRI